MNTHVVSLQNSDLNQDLERRCQEQGYDYLTLTPFVIRFLAWYHSEYDHWIAQQRYGIFLSPNAVTGFASAWPHPWPKNTQWIAIGSGTQAALQLHTTASILTPSHASSEAVLALPELQQVMDQTCLVVKGLGGRLFLTQQLQQRGAQVQILDCYERVPQHIDIASLAKIWQNGAQAIVVATSGAALHELIQQVTPPLLAWLTQQPLVVSSERLSHYAQALGFSHRYQAERLSASALFNAIKELL